MKILVTRRGLSDLMHIDKGHFEVPISEYIDNVHSISFNEGRLEVYKIVTLYSSDGSFGDEKILSHAFNQGRWDIYVRVD